MGNLVVRDLRVDRDGRSVLKGCTAEFLSRRRTVLWGRSGVGKSTLLGAIAGLVTPEDGSITLGSQVLFSALEQIDVPPYKRRIGYLFQDLALWPHLTALQQVHLVGRALGLDVAGAYARLESVGLASVTDRRPGQLSGGEQQRLAIARALAGAPSTLLLDEPFSSVDRQTRSSLYDLLGHVSAQLPGPTIYVTHDAHDAETLAEYTLELRDGVVARVERPWRQT